MMGSVASSAGHTRNGEWPEANSIGSTHSHSRAMRIDHAGETARSAVQTIDVAGASGSAASGHGSALRFAGSIH